MPSRYDMWVYSDQLLVLPYVTATVVGGIYQIAAMPSTAHLHAAGEGCPVCRHVTVLLRCLGARARHGDQDDAPAGLGTSGGVARWYAQG